MSQEHSTTRSLSTTMMPFVALLLASVILFSGCTQTENPEDTNQGQENSAAMMEGENQENEHQEDTMGDDHADMGMDEEGDESNMVEADVDAVVEAGATGVLVDADASADVDVIYEMGGVNFAFTMDGEENPTLRVKEGEKVRIEFTSTDGFHDWVVDEFDAATKQVRTDGTTSVEFIADKKGTFEYYCSVGQHRENGMKGMLIVE